jgi:hypothetical protein
MSLKGQSQRLSRSALLQRTCPTNQKIVLGTVAVNDSYLKRSVAP